MRISDWSSDVCSSDLLHDLHPRRRGWIADLRRPVMRLVRVLVGSALAALFVGGITAWIFSSHDGRADANATAQMALGKTVYVANCASCHGADLEGRSEEHTSELQSLMRISYAVFCLKKKKQSNNTTRYV